MNFREFLKENNVILDGAMGSLLQKRGLAAAELPERLNISCPDEIIKIHKEYFAAGADVVSTNTFGANSLKFSDNELDGIIRCALENAKAAREGFPGKYVALDIGPSGKLLKPLGDLDFEDAVAVFAKTVKLGVKYGADLIIIETMSDSYETKAALLAAKENSELPVIVTCVYGRDGKLMTGADAYAMAAMLEGLGADAIGANCSLGPRELIPVCRALSEAASVPIVMKPNAGLPRIVGDKTVYDVESRDFSEAAELLYEAGASVIGGCCGTTPEYISAVKRVISAKKVRPVSKKSISVISSYTHAVKFGELPVLIGERINPTGKKRLKEALISNKLDYLLGEAVRQEEMGAHALDVNAGLPEINEREMLPKIIREVQTVTALPLQIDTSDKDALEAALRVYNGKPMINSVNGKEESLNSVLPLAKKYGALTVALTLDENGIPEDAEGRFDIAKRILCRAEEYGIDKKDIIFDPLTLTVSANPDAAKTTLEALRLIKERLGANCILGVSNVSFGLPERDALNAAFFTMALKEGLSAAIMNPYSPNMMQAYYASLALFGKDFGFSRYIEAAKASFGAPVSQNSADAVDKGFTLKAAIEAGMGELSGKLTEDLLDSGLSGIEIVNTEIIPALNTVGEKYERGEAFLPSLIMSAEAAGAAFEKIKAASPSKDATDECDILIASVKGDIHDIGKNIVKLILENYGFSVYDLGRDVSPDLIVSEAIRRKAKIVGLSALMTTTAPAMKETVEMLKEKAPSCKVMVGGAVITEEYAEKIGADKYARDAMEGLAYTKSILEK